MALTITEALRLPQEGVILSPSRGVWVLLFRISRAQSFGKLQDSIRNSVLPSMTTMAKRNQVFLRIVA